MTYSQNLIKRRAENRKAAAKRETGKNHGTPVEGNKSKACLARIGRRKAIREENRIKALKKKK